jgi:hypothetical protein
MVQNAMASSSELDLAAPNNVKITPGHYENAEVYAFHATGAPGLSFLGSGIGCNTVTGRFVVNDVSYTRTGVVQHFGADFEQHCDGDAPALFGSIRINSILRQFSITRAVISQKAKNLAIFTVTLNPSIQTPVSVNFATADGTALADVDYRPVSGVITFLPGQTSHTISVQLLDEAGSGKTFFGQLSSPSGASVWLSQGEATF